MAGGWVVDVDRPGERWREHDRASRAWVGEALAILKGYEYAGPFDPQRDYAAPLYAVPCDALLPEEAQALAVRSGDDLFGGVVPHAFVRTKSVVHPLVDGRAQSPYGWTHGLAEAIGDAVLRGYTTFSREDARNAAALLLERGPARAKLSRQRGGKGQAVLSKLEDLEPLLALESEADLMRFGLVVEEQLEEMETYSVGQVCVDGLIASYCGTQRSVANREGKPVYGGSDLLLVRGDFDRLSALDLPAPARTAIAQAQRFDAATQAAYRGLLHSRGNYDVLRGRDAAGRVRSGVLEQSWRIGGASAAEVAALLEFRADQGLQAVRASTFELYGAGEPPAAARLLYRGSGADGGPHCKYCTVGPA